MPDIRKSSTSPVFAASPATATVGEAARVLTVVDLSAYFPPRAKDSHKGDSGRVACIGGDHGHGGAILLCAEGALRAGAGLLRAATRSAHVPALLARRPEAMAVGLGEVPEGLDDLFAWAGCVAIGPGLGTSPWGRALADAAFDSDRPLVVDADALNRLADRPRQLPGAVLTPHPGEAARLLGWDTTQVQGDRVGAARALVERYAATVILKGAGTLVAAPGRPLVRIGAGNPGMAVGGMGDLLTGVVAALCVAGQPAYEAACGGALVHSVAGDAAAAEGGERGLLPSDLLPWLRRYANPPAQAGAAA